MISVEGVQNHLNCPGNKIYPLLEEPDLGLLFSAVSDSLRDFEDIVKAKLQNNMDILYVMLYKKHIKTCMLTYVCIWYILYIYHMIYMIYMI